MLRNTGMYLECSNQSQSHRQLMDFIWPQCAAFIFEFNRTKVWRRIFVDCASVNDIGVSLLPQIKAQLLIS